MTLREKLMHYTHDLDCGADLKQEAIATIEHIAQYMDEDELLHHSRPLALAYLALTEDASAPVVHGWWTEEDWVEMDSDGHLVRTPKAALRCSNCRHCFKKELLWKDNYCPNCGAKMDGGNS